MLSIALAVLAAVGNAVASVLQRRAGADQPEEQGGPITLLWRLAHRPDWLGGIAALIAGFLCQAAALATGPIALVQPILVLELAFTLVLAQAVFRSSLHLREWGAIAGMSAGLAALLYALQPSGGDPAHASAIAWILGVAAALALSVVFAVVGYRSAHSRRAAFLGLATGVGFGLTAVLLAGISAIYALSGAGGVLAAPQTYLLVVLGPVFFFLLQKSLQAGSLVAAQPALTLSNPVIAIVFGIVVFGEQVHTGGWVALSVVGAAAIAACTVALTRSPLLQDGESSGSDVAAGDASRCSP
ncbi:DMT family transporter [Pseudonocardia xinjiangensis]|uniref:DMT family transporter n=1 Tax=Pseudonocardia xinjiangensis TaxID=75289 RepID=A0ABX1RDU9_9PSEU|nr:DMT family transporter [Pseudonocardia xinjiangensis]NMH78552.1 DMT family transporter [Pseudonocardia xinjiangensis]